MCVCIVTDIFNYIQYTMTVGKNKTKKLCVSHTTQCYATALVPYCACYCALILSVDYKSVRIVYAIQTDQSQ
jgi:hypothetical protein